MAKKDNGYNGQKRTVQHINEEYGRMPPQATELEEMVLGALMLDSNAILTVAEILQPESFYIEANQKIFGAIYKLSKELKPIDMMTVMNQLKNQQELDPVGGTPYLAQLTRKVTSTAHLEFHAHIVAQKYIQRELIRVSANIQNKAYDENQDINDLLDFSEQSLFDIVQGNIKKETVKIDTVMQQAIQQIEEASKRSDGLSGVPCGFTALDRMTSGWQKSDLIIIAARPSMGKTAFVLSMMRNIAVEHNQGVALFSLEMSAVQLANRLIVGETGLQSDKIKTGKLSDAEWTQLDVKIKDLAEAPIFIDDTPGISIFELRAKARRLKMTHDIQMVIVDYLQLMSGDDGNSSREQEVSNISRGLKAVAKELDIPIIALSQLNRSVEMRGGDKRPQISDLRESGAIEQDADIVTFIYRAERYGITQDEDGNPTKNKAELIVAKHRNGSIGTVELKFIDEQAKFMDAEETALGPLDEGGEVRFSSKMNQADNTPGEGAPIDNNDITSNFEDEDAPF